MMKGRKPMIDKKITIGLFNDSFYPMTDGVIMVVDNYAKRLSKYANVIVFVPSYKDRPFDDSVFPYKVVRCKSLNIPFLDHTLPTPKLDHAFVKELNKYNLDIVHIHSPFTIGVAGVKYAKKHHIPCIATMHSQFKQDFQKAVRNDKVATVLNNRLMKVFEECDECWAVNKEVARIYHEEYGYRCLPRVMNNATELKPLQNDKKANTYINKLYHIKPREKVFLFVGRLNTLKNILFIVDALKAVTEKAPRLKFTMLFVGTGIDEEKLRHHIEKNNLQKQIILCGKITDREILAYHYRRADLFLFPSVYDASSIVQIEAASQMTPTVFLKNTATACDVIDNVNGYLSDYSVGAYSDKIIDALKDQKLYNKIAKNAFIDLYKNWNTTVDEVYALYKEHIDSAKKEKTH